MIISIEQFFRGRNHSAIVINSNGNRLTVQLSTVCVLIIFIILMNSSLERELNFLKTTQIDTWNFHSNINRKLNIKLLNLLKDSF